MADLLRGFVQEEWVGQVDISTLERVGGGYVSDDLRERESDVVWRLKWGGESWVYIYLLLEFQSTIDLSMALRVLSYVSLLYQDLHRQRMRTPSGRLPPVMPIVLYNGARPWHAALDVAELIEEVPGGLERHRPSLRYWLIDESRLAESELASERNLAAALFRLETSGSLAGVDRVVAALSELLAEPEHLELRRAFTIWLTRVLLPSRLPGVHVPALAELREVRSMLADHAIDWTREWKEQGREEGREEGFMPCGSSRSTCWSSASALCRRRRAGRSKRSCPWTSSQGCLAAPSGQRRWPTSACKSRKKGGRPPGESGQAAMLVEESGQLAVAETVALTALSLLEVSTAVMR